jgi:hypothetical protein
MATTDSIEQIRKIFGVNWQPSPAFTPALQQQGIYGAVRIPGTQDVYTIGPGGGLETPESFKSKFGTLQQEGVVGPVSQSQLESFKSLYAANTAKVPATAEPSTDMTASFLSQFQNVGSAMAELNKTAAAELAPDIAGEQAASARRKEAITRTYESTIEATKQAAQPALRDLQKASQLLQETEIVNKSRVNDYLVTATDFNTRLTKTIADLGQQEADALSNEDYNTAQTIRTEKLDWYNLQRQSLTDQWNTISSAYNMLLSVKKTQQEEVATAKTDATNYINSIVAAYGNVPYAEIPADVRASLEEQGAAIGWTPDVLKQTFSGKVDVKGVQSIGGYLVSYDSAGNIINKTWVGTSDVTGSRISNIDKLVASKQTAVIDALDDTTGKISANDYNQIRLELPASAVGAFDDKYSGFLTPEDRAQLTKSASLNTDNIQDLLKALGLTE